MALFSKTKGFFIVIEGSDGSGKTEQFKKLKKKLEQEKYQVATYDFPQYGKSSAYFVEKYLRGEYGGMEENQAEKASLFYALDRFDISQQIKKDLKQGKIVLANRYVASNLGHQGAKIDSISKRHQFFTWARNLEYQILGIPKPDLNIILYLSYEMRDKLIAKKDERKYLKGKKRDIHEKDLNHLEKSGKVYLEIAKLFPKDFVLVRCVKKNQLLSINEIHEKIWKVLSNLI